MSPARPVLTLVRSIESCRAAPAPDAAMAIALHVARDDESDLADDLASRGPRLVIGLSPSGTIAFVIEDEHHDELAMLRIQKEMDSASIRGFMELLLAECAIRRRLAVNDG